MTSIFIPVTHLTHDTSFSFTPWSSRTHYIVLSERQSDCAAIVVPHHPNPLSNTPLFLTGVCMISGRKMPPPSQRKSFCCSQPGTQQTATLSQEERERDKEDRQERRKAQSALPRPLTALSKDLRGMLGVSNNQNIHKHGCAAFLSTDL